MKIEFVVLDSNLVPVTVFASISRLTGFSYDSPLIFVFPIVDTSFLPCPWYPHWIPAIANKSLKKKTPRADAISWQTSNEFCQSRRDEGEKTDYS